MNSSYMKVAIFNDRHFLVSVLEKIQARMRVITLIAIVTAPLLFDCSDLFQYCMNLDSSNQRRSERFARQTFVYLPHVEVQELTIEFGHNGTIHLNSMASSARWLR